MSDDEDYSQPIAGPSQTSDPDYQFVPRDDDNENLWEVVEIVAEKGKKYRVRWAGLNPKTQRPWPLDWVPKCDCTPDLVKAWKEQKAKKKKPPKGKSNRKTVPKTTATSTATRKGKEPAGSTKQSTDTTTRDTRSTAHNGSKGTIRPGPSRRVISSSPGAVIKVGPPVALKRKRATEQGATTVVNDSQPIPTEPPKRKRKLGHSSSTSQTAGSSTRVAEDSPSSGKGKPDSTLADLPPPEPDLEPDPHNNSNFWDGPFDEEDRAAHDSRQDVIPESQPVEDPDNFDNPDNYEDRATGPSKRKANNTNGAHPHSSNSKPHPRVTNMSPQRAHVDSSLTNEMEIFVDYSAGAGEHSPVQSPPKRRTHLQSHSSAPNTPRSPRHQPGNHPPEASIPSSPDLLFPPTASTQRAVIDSQSRILVPDSQEIPDVASLREMKELVVELRARLHWQEDATKAAEERLQERDDEIEKLLEQIATLRSDQEDMVPVERFEKQAAELSSAKAKIEHLETSVALAQKEAQQNLEHERRIRELEADIEHWREQCDALKVEEQRADEAARQWAEDEAKLRAQIVTLEDASVMLKEKVAELETLAEDMEMENDLTKTAVTELEAAVIQLQEEKADLEKELAEANRRLEVSEREKKELSLEAEMLRQDRAELQESLGARIAELASVAESAKMSLSVSAELPTAWACVYRPEDGAECRKIFHGREELRQHLLAVHYSKQVE